MFAPLRRVDALFAPHLADLSSPAASGAGWACDLADARAAQRRLLSRRTAFLRGRQLDMHAPLLFSGISPMTSLSYSDTSSGAPS